MFSPDQRLQERISAADAGIDIVRATLFPDHSALTELYGSEATPHGNGKVAINSKQTAQVMARDFVHENTRLSALIATAVSGDINIVNKHELVIGLGHEAFPSKPKAAELFSAIVLHKLDGDLARPGGKELIAAKLDELRSLVEPGEFQAAFGPFSKGVSEARAQVSGRLVPVAQHLNNQFANGVGCVLISIDTDSHIQSLFNSLEAGLSELQAAGVTHIGLPLGEVSPSDHCGYYQGAQLKRELEELQQILQRAGFNVFSTYVTDPELRKTSLGVSDDLYRRIADLGPATKCIAFVEPDQLNDIAPDTRVAHRFTPLLTLLTSIRPRNEIATIRWVARNETLAGFSANGKSAVRGIQATDLISLEQGEFCIVQNEAGNAKLNQLLQHHMGCQADAVLLEG